MNAKGYEESQKAYYNKCGLSGERRLPGQPPDRIYYWAWGIIDGRRSLFGCWYTESEAEDAAYLKFRSGDYEIIPLPTKNEARASRIMRGTIDGEDKDILNRFKHKT